MAAFTRPTIEDLNQILFLYNLPPLISMEPIGHGISNSNFKIELPDRKILLKISDDKGESDLLAEVELLNFLKSKNFPYSVYPLKRPGEEVIYHYKDKVGLIFNFIEGTIPKINEESCFKIGHALGALHCLDPENTLRSYEKVGYGPKTIQAYLNQKNCPKEFKLIFKEVFPNNLDLFLSNSFENGFIHGDLYYDNTLFFKNELKAILDFEQAGIGPFILDIGISISGSCLENGKINKKLMNSYILGYESARRLAKEEKTFLNEAILIGLFSISLWRIKRFREGNLDPSRKDSYLELLIRAKDFKNENQTS